MGNIASRFKWVFGTAEAANSPGRGVASNVKGSTGAGVAFNTHGWGESFSFVCEADAAATCSYQIRSARTSSGPWAVLSSGTLSTSGSTLVQLSGPLFWLSPRCKTLNSTANQFVIEMSAVES
jgi:hypothetical protein